MADRLSVHDRVQVLDYLSQLAFYLNRLATWLVARLHQPDAHPAGWAYVVKPVQSITTQGSSPSIQASWPGAISA